MRTRVRTRGKNRDILGVAIVLGTISACASDPVTKGECLGAECAQGSGGTPTTGGTSSGGTATGGAPGQGGVTLTTGGKASTGGTSSTGGSGGKAGTGGAATTGGAAATGGKGGSGTGGSANTGGSSKGGANTGGMSAAGEGGASEGGAPEQTGGKSTGGSSTGGTATGGAATGGTSTGGTSSTGRQSLQSEANTDLYLVDASGTALAQSVDTDDQQATENATFVVVAGLAPGTDATCPEWVSFHSVVDDTLYLRHRNYQLWLEENTGTTGFFDDATFCQRPGLEGSGTISLEAQNFPDFHVRTRGSTEGAEIWLDELEADPYPIEASWNLVAPLAP